MHTDMSAAPEKSVNKHEITPKHQMLTRRGAACMAKERPSSQAVLGQRMCITQGSACTTQELSTERPSQTRPRQASTARQHSTAHSTKQPSFAARRYDPSLPITTNLGGMSVQCTFCRAKRWALEPASLCCCNGKVQLDSLCNPPEPLNTLYLSDTCESKHALQHTRKYNSAFSMTSFECHEVRKSGWNPSFKIQSVVAPERRSREACQR